LATRRMRARATCPFRFRSPTSSSDRDFADAEGGTVPPFASGYEEPGHD
jgi:hypothetical protein